jgi:hypothetical protein
MIKAMQPSVNAKSRSCALGWSGLLLGIAFITLQKCPITEDLYARIRQCIWQAIGLVTVTYFYAKEGAWCVDSL